MVFINFQRRRNASVDKGRDDVNDVHITHIQVSVTHDRLTVTDHGDLYYESQCVLLSVFCII